jgi:hypothetical protein
MSSMRLGKDTTAASWWPLRGRRRELFLITAAMVPAIGELDLGDDVGMIEDRGILARIEGWAGAAKLQRGDGRPYATGRGGSL